jgi:site-specific DNA recombinase
VAAQGGHSRLTRREKSMKLAAIYARVSSDKQDVDLSISAQLKALRDYAGRESYQVVREYVDEAESGRSIDRPGFKAMIAAARQNSPPFEAILVWKLSRFARNREDSIIYKSLLRKHGVQVVSINEPVEDTPSGRLLEGIIEVIDEFYSANLSQDVVRGMRENASRGFYPGGSIPFGLRKVQVQDGDTPRTKLEPDPASAPVVERMFRESAAGRGLKEIAKGLNKDGLRTRSGKKWGTTSVHNALKNEAYAGVLVWDRGRRRRFGVNGERSLIRVEGAWAPIVDRQTFDQVQSRLASRAPKVTHPRIVQSQYVLSGMIRCGNCGAAMSGQSAKSGQFFYYMCGNFRRRGRDACSIQLLPKTFIEQLVIERIKQNILTRENLEGLVKIVNAEMDQALEQDREGLNLVRAQIADVDGRLAKLYDALETGDFTSRDLAPRIRSLNEKKEELVQAESEAQARLQNRVTELSNPETVLRYAEDLKALLEHSSIVEQRAFLKSFVRSIVITPSRVTIEYTIPLPNSGPGGVLTEGLPVLSFIQNGSAGRTRTYDQPVTSVPVFLPGSDYLITRPERAAQGEGVGR